MTGISGRPRNKSEENKTSEIKVRCLPREKEEIIRLAKTYGLSMTAYVLRRSLGQKITFNHIELLKELHRLNLELARTGNNINQLARYANTMNKAGKLKPEIADKLHAILASYIQKQDEVRVAFRKLIRMMSK
ncbi:plasmid mobilization protein [Gaoshiqia sp. Z1-71]|uniref:plasmid mobilization protein n=1 Tax=Gaoshiqia hydrogeniformans TaxID=3290090 RepID=UPI003BF83110